MRSEFEKHFLSLKFATEGSAQRCLDSCTFDPEQDAYLPDVNWISDNDMDECVIYCCMLNTTYISFKDQQSKVDELTKQLIDQGQRLNVQTQQIASLKWQLKRLGYTDNGGELMKPPIGDAPKFDLLDELQKKNAWLSDVAKRENKRANKLQEEKVSTTTLLGKTIQEKNELQKRVEAALTILSSKKKMYVDMVIEIEQALKGGDE